MGVRERIHAPVVGVDVVVVMFPGSGRHLGEYCAHVLPL